MRKVVNVSIDSEKLTRIDDYCNAHNLTRSKFFDIACTEYINAKTIEPDLKLALESLSKSFEDLAKKSKDLKALSS